MLEEESVSLKTITLTRTTDKRCKWMPLQRSRWKSANLKDGGPQLVEDMTTSFSTAKSWTRWPSKRRTGWSSWSKNRNSRMERLLSLSLKQSSSRLNSMMRMKNWKTSCLMKDGQNGTRKTFSTSSEWLRNTAVTALAVELIWTVFKAAVRNPTRN